MRQDYPPSDANQGFQSHGENNNYYYIIFILIIIIFFLLLFLLFNSQVTGFKYTPNNPKASLTTSGKVNIKLAFFISNLLWDKRINPFKNIKNTIFYFPWSPFCHLFSLLWCRMLETSSTNCISPKYVSIMSIKSWEIKRKWNKAESETYRPKRQTGRYAQNAAALVLNYTCWNCS